MHIGAPFFLILPGELRQHRLEHRVGRGIHRPGQGGMAFAEFVRAGKDLENASRRSKFLPVEARMLEVELRADRHNHIRLRDE